METSKRQVIVQIHRVDWINLTALVKTAGTKFNKLGNGDVAVSVNIEFNRDLTKNAEIGIVINTKFATKPKSLKFMDTKMRICDFIDKLNVIPLIKEIYIEVMRTSNLPHTCPIRGVRNWY